MKKSHKVHSFVCVHTVSPSDNNNNIDLMCIDKHNKRHVYTVSVSANIVKHGGAFGDRTILLDTCAGESIFLNKNLFTNIVYTDRPVEFEGVNIDGEPLYITMIGHTQFGDNVYYSEHSRANILSFARMGDFADELVHNAECNLFRMCIGDLTYYFRRHPVYNVYSCNLDKDVYNRKAKKATAAVLTVNEQIRKYSKREVEEAETARDFMRKMGFGVQALKKLITAGKIDNCKITTHAIDRAVDIWGKDLAFVKGKTTTHASTPQQQEPLAVTRVNQVMCCDILWVNDLMFLIFMFSPLEYAGVVRVRKKDTHTLAEAIKTALSVATRKGFNVTTIYSDPESGVKSEAMLAKFPDGPDFDITGGEEAVASIERKIRDLKDGVRGKINTLPFKLSDALEGWLVRYVISRINLMPTTNSIDLTSPRERLYGRRIDANKELKHDFGEYVQVHLNKLSHNMNSRTVGAISLLPTGNIAGSWYYYVLNTNQVISRDRATTLPMPEEVIQFLNNLASDRKTLHQVPLFERGLYKHAAMNDDSPAIEEAPVSDQPVEQVIIQPATATDDTTEHEYDIGPDEDDVEDMNDVPDAHIHRGESFEYEDPSPESHGDYSQDALPEIAQDAEPTTYEEPAVVEMPEEPTVSTPVRRSNRLAAKERVVWDKRLVAYTRLSDFVARDRRNINSTKTRYAFLSRKVGNMTVHQGLEKLGYDAVLSIVRELMSILDFDVWEGVDVSTLSEQELKRIITSSLFLREKYTADGVFDKLKSRLVAGGHLMDHRVYDKGASPTVATMSILMVASIAAVEKRAVASLDIPSAFLHAPMPQDPQKAVYMKLNKFLTSVLCKIDPTYEKFVRKDGTCVVKLKRALYGCIESARLFYDKLKTDLEKLGFSVNPLDMCVFNRKEKDGSQSTIACHVDDLFLSAKDEGMLDVLCTEIENIYPGSTGKRGRSINYLGMTLDFSEEGKVKIFMKKSVDDILEFRSRLTGVGSTPAKTDLFTVVNDGILSAEDTEFFHSAVAKILYLSKRIRAELLTACAYLTRRVQKPTNSDYEKLRRLVQYIRATKDYFLTLEPDKDLSITAYIDAAYGVHDDYRSHTGTVIQIGKATIYASSKKQRINTKSSTEAELVGLSDYIGQVIWCKSFLEHQGRRSSSTVVFSKPAVVYQDNTSTIRLVKNGTSTSDKTRHIGIRYFFVKDRVEKKDIEIKYKRTEEMIADLLTKPLQGKLFSSFRDAILNRTEKP